MKATMGRHTRTMTGPISRHTSVSKSSLKMPSLSELSTSAHEAGQVTVVS